ncbi:MAG TPA: LytTR family DNA-binding domain-containing protein [Phnomibacter sp.]|nr:LytTR family DNA-binding domain-containing protein [Phnomibacter sp.]
MRTVIVDDEPINREYLRHLLDLHFPWVKLVGEAGTVTEALNLVNDTCPDLLLLDVELGNETSFDLLDLLTDFRCMVIFVTGYNEYAVKAFEVRAIHYLLKPVTASALRKALELARAQYEVEAARPMIGSLAHLLKEVEKSKNHITISDRGGRHRILVSEIEYCSCYHGIVELHRYDNEKIVVSKDFSDLQNQLEAFNFLRCHQSYLVNGHYVKGSKREDGKMFLVMKSHAKVPVARANINWVRRELNL